MKLSFFGADQCVTGSCHCLEVNGKKILVDCGLQQGRDEVSNAEFPFAAGSVDYVLITHAHIDHSGRVPMLIKQGFRGQILTTRLTADLMDIMLLDSAHIQESDAEWKNRKAARSGAPHVEPLYTIEDAAQVREYMTTCEYGQKVTLCEGVTVEFIDAGHLLGSASILVDATEGGVTKRLVFSGDIGNVPPCAATVGPRDLAAAREIVDLEYLTACGGNPGQQKFVAKLALFGPAAPENPGALLRMQKGAMYVSEDVARPPVYAPDEDWLDGALAEIQAREAMEV